MQYDEFINRVQERANFETHQEALNITQAVLDVLGERLDRKVRNGVTAQLPAELKGYLSARSESQDRYDVPEFYNRVGARAGLKYYDAAERTWQVISVLAEAIPAGEKQQILDSLPGEFQELFGETRPQNVRPKP